MPPRRRTTGPIEVAASTSSPAQTPVCSSVVTQHRIRGMLMICTEQEILIGEKDKDTGKGRCRKIFNSGESS